MRFAIAPEGDNLLPVVQRLPGEQVGRLEGYNGVGKTLAAIVLQICTGTQPLLTGEQQARWEGLREGLGRLRVTAEDLADGDRIQWRLDSRLWPVDVTKAIDVTDEWFDVEINGEAATLADVRRLVQVERIAGNLGLLETLADEADAERAKVEAFGTRISDRREALEQVVGSLASFLRPLEPNAYAAQAHRVEEARKTAERALAALTASNGQVRALQEAIGLRDQLSELESVGPDLERQVEALAGQITERQLRSAGVLDEIKALSPTAAQSAEAAKSLNTANRSLKRANTRLTNASDTLATAAARVGLRDIERAEEELETARAQLADAQERRKALTSRPEMLELLTGIDGPLRLAQNRNLGAQVMMLDPLTPGREWTVDELYEALGERREALKTAPAIPAVEEVEREVDRLTERASELARIPRLRAELETAQRGMRTASARVKQLNEQAQNPASGKIAELEKRLEATNDELIALGAEQARLERQRYDLAAGRTPEDLTATLQRRLADLGFDAPELEGALSEELDAADKLQPEYGLADEQLRRASAELASLSEQVSRLVVGLHDRPEFEWLAAGAATLVPAPADPFESKLNMLERLAAAVRAADARLEGIRQAPLSVSFALAALARDLRGAREDAKPPLMPAMTNWLEGRATDWFAEESVRNFVLPEAHGEVIVDLEGRRVLGHHEDGSPISKPLEGFSSGEQAFAFTQAQLALLDHRSSGAAAQRLVILDEFGAFIAAKGRQQLAAQLRHWSETHPSDQIVVILPTTQDYEALAASASKDRRKQLLKHASDLAQNEYFIAPFEDR
jgi:hypothetical protein